MKTKKITSILLGVFITLTAVSCSKDEDSGNVALKAKATFNPLSPKTAVAQRNLSTITISSFMINIKEIEFEIDDDDDQNENLYSDLELKGPFELDLSSGNVSIDITSINLPLDVYDEIEFKLHKSNNNLSELFGKSIQIKGKLNGIPFVFWHNFEEEFEVDYVNNAVDVIVDGTSTSAIINFDLNAVFGSTSTIDFTGAKDGNGNGIIEINPNNDDGNASLADFIKNLLKDNCELEEEED